MTEEGRRPLDDYLSDLKTVKDLLARHDEKSMLEPWAFHVWGVIVAIATSVHLVLAGRFPDGESALVASVWIPVLLAGGLGELVAWLSRMNRENTPLFGRRFVRFVLSAVGVFATIVPIVLTL
mgnify:CR=1 FL=1